MLTYSLKKTVSEPLYENLYRKIRADILSGHLKGNEKLPSKRAFAKHLDVSIITVEGAYDQLLTEGYIYALPRKGYFVSELDNLQIGSRGGRNDSAQRSKETLLSLQRQQNASADGMFQSQETTAAGDAALEQGPPSPRWFADFSSNQTQPESFPFSTWAKLSRKVLSDRQEDLMRNSPSGGVWTLKCAIAEHLADFRDIHVSPEQIIVAAGTELLYGMVIQLLGFDLCYGAENPGYRKVSQIFESYKVAHAAIPLDRSGVSVQQLEARGVDVIHVTPSHHFPTGITMPAARRYELLSWADQAENRYILEDDYDSEMRMSGRPLPALLSIDRSERVIYMNTFTKSLASTIRISYMVLPPHLARRFREKMQFYSCTVSNFEQYTLAEMIGSGLFEKHINRMRNASRKKRDVLLTAIRESELGAVTTILEKHAGLHFLMNIRMTIPAEHFQQALAREGIVMTGLDRFFLEENRENQELWKVGDGLPEHTFVVNYSSVPVERVEEAIARISRALEADFSENNE